MKVGLEDIGASGNDQDMLTPITRSSQPEITTEIHIWSAGGDGTAMTVFEELMKHGVYLTDLYFSSIPFGTGNDFSQVLGWGRTIKHADVVGHGLEQIVGIAEARLSGQEARLDISGGECRGL